MTTPNRSQQAAHRFFAGLFNQGEAPFAPDITHNLRAHGIISSYPARKASVALAISPAIPALRGETSRPAFEP